MAATMDTPTTFKLKPISKEGIDGAIAKADHYRLLNHPKLAESICLDILEIEPENQKALVILLLSLTDQFGQSSSTLAKNATNIAEKLKDEYARIYYSGIVHERQGAVSLNSSLPGSDYDAYEWYIEAMEFYEKADALAPSSNEDAVLRWNTCARIIMQRNLKPRPDDRMTPQLE